ncbi:DJ-1/PfpI family protein [Streptomyces sp. NPDC020794]|uniref:DJ-1/PfpI family protein n=1 Tax=unclassified Streptomyces TaxID=2593676 RepID=UPI0036E37B3B
MWGTSSRASFDGIGAKPISSKRRVLASVCTGSLPLAAAGLPAGRPATTHRNHLEKLAKIDGSIDVGAGVRYVDDSDVVTWADVSAGIDMALHLVHRSDGLDASELPQTGIQYKPHSG